MGDHKLDPESRKNCYCQGIIGTVMGPGSQDPQWIHGENSWNSAIQMRKKCIFFTNY